MPHAKYHQYSEDDSDEDRHSGSVASRKKSSSNKRSFASNQPPQSQRPKKKQRKESPINTNASLTTPSATTSPARKVSPPNEMNFSSPQRDDDDDSSDEEGKTKADTANLKTYVGELQKTGYSSTAISENIALEANLLVGTGEDEAETKTKTFGAA